MATITSGLIIFTIHDSGAAIALQKHPSVVISKI